MANYKKEVIEASQQIVQSGIMTKSLHGNVSMKLPDQDAFLLTAGGSLATMQPENIALFRLDGTLIEGTVMPVGAEIIQMHGVVYRAAPGVFERDPHAFAVRDGLRRGWQADSRRL